MKRVLKDQSGFTLVEMIIVIIIMGILAAVIVPQIGTTSDDAKLSAVKQDLSSMRNAVEIYYSQHNSAYPGARDVDGNPPADDTAAATAFVRQLTEYTDVNGDCVGVKDATHKYGPYVKGGQLPVNPFNDSNAVTCDGAETDITVRTSDGTNTAGWHFRTQTGVLVANDSDPHATGL